MQTHTHTLPLSLSLFLGLTSLLLPGVSRQGNEVSCAAAPPQLVASAGMGALAAALPAAQAPLPTLLAAP